ncbi:MAG TPA: hypothetical protein VMH24_09140 [Candidatus Sulfotelmatobacter sp.]|nr:hypothetical protein [Candidatus Sulfotelmatobacter sp.]
MVQDWAGVTLGGWFAAMLVMAGLALLACGGLLLIVMAVTDAPPIRGRQRPSRPHAGVIGWRQLHPDWRHPGPWVAPARPASALPFTLALSTRAGHRRVAPPADGVPGWPPSGT